MIGIHYSAGVIQGTMLLALVWGFLYAVNQARIFCSSLLLAT